MSQSNYLDELDNLFDAPSRTEKDQPKATSAMGINPVTTNSPPHHTAEDTAAARETWAKIIENASKALNDGSLLTQEAVQKNIELAKAQQETIKELVDASSGWRHATRQAVQEVNAAKKSVITLTVISAVIAVAGFGTTIGVMLQSRSGMISMSNTVLENVDEHQSLVSKTLNIKMDELTSTIEQMQSVLDQLAQNNQPAATKTTLPNTAETASTADATPSIATAAILETVPATENSATATDTDHKNTTSNKTATTATTTVTAVSPSSTTITAPVTPTTAEVSANEANAQQLQKLSDQLQALQQQLTTMETNLPVATEALNQKMQTLNAQLEASLSARLEQNKAPSTTTLPTAAVKPTIIQDNKPVLDQLNRLRQDIAEIRVMQTALKDQLLQLKQSKSDAKPYQYRTTPDDIETYPR